MSELLVKQKDIVVPGQELAVGMDFLPAYGSYRDGDKIIANCVGLANIDGRLIKIIPLSGKYSPKRGDTVVGRVVDMSFSNWYVDIGCANDAVLSSRETGGYVDRGADLTKIYNFGDYIVAEISKVTRGVIEITTRGPGLRKLGSGRIIKVNPTKVPRIIGKQGSMVTLIKDKTGCRITVGQNGLVWIQGEPDKEMKALEAIKIIEKKAHLEGLTDEITKFLSDGSEKIEKGGENAAEKKA